MGTKGKRALSCVVIVCLLAGMCVGCKAKEKAEPIEITLMHGWGGTLKTHNTMQGIYDEFSKENPDIVIKSIPYSDSSIAVEKANDMLAVGKIPDILSTNGLSYYVSNAIKRQEALDLMPYIQADKELAKAIHPSVYQTWTTKEGALFTVPDALEVSGYWYNADYLKQAGVTDAEGNAEVPRTWEAFLSMAKKLQTWISATGQDAAVCALDNVQKVEYLFPARLAGTGTKGLAAVNSPSEVVDENALRETMTDLQTLFALSAEVDNIENSRQNFSIGKSALYFNGVWESNTLSESKLSGNFAYANYPSQEGESLAYISASSGYVLAKQKDERKAKACISFLKYMLSKEVQSKIAVETGQAPSNPNIDRAGIIKEYPLFGQALNRAYEADVELKMLRSVWSEQKVAVIQNYVQSKSLSTEEISQMAQELNQIN